MFKNLTLYRISEEWQPEFHKFEDQLSNLQFVSCEATQERSIGWVPPRGEKHGAFAESIGGHWVMRALTETKILPASVLKQAVVDRVAALETKEGRKAGKKEKQELKDECKLDLLPQAFVKQSGVWVWIDLSAGILALDTTSQAKADEVITMLVETFPGFAVSFLDTQSSPQGSMSAWLHSFDAPDGFSLGQECELKSSDESKAVVRYGRHPLDIEEVRQHIDQGKLPTKLSLTWDDRVSFVLTDSLQLKKVALLDVVLEGQNQDVDGFDADVAIATGELSQLIPTLISALGGEGRTAL